MNEHQEWDIKFDINEKIKWFKEKKSLYLCVSFIYVPYTKSCEYPLNLLTQTFELSSSVKVTCLLFNFMAWPFLLKHFKSVSFKVMTKIWVCGQITLLEIKNKKWKTLSLIASNSDWKWNPTSMSPKCTLFDQNILTKQQ